MLNRIGLCGLIVAMGWPAAAGEALTARVIAASGLARSDVVIEALIQQDARNRAVSFEIDSDGYYTKSVAQLDGAQAARLKQVIFRTVPAGSYEVRVTLLGADGERGRVVATFSLW
jgi:hypothetical protein